MLSKYKSSALNYFIFLLTKSLLFAAINIFNTYYNLVLFSPRTLLQQQIFPELKSFTKQSRKFPISSCTPYQKQTCLRQASNLPNNQINLFIPAKFLLLCLHTYTHKISPKNKNPKKSFAKIVPESIKKRVSLVIKNIFTANIVKSQQAPHRISYQKRNQQESSLLTLIKYLHSQVRKKHQFKKILQKKREIHNQLIINLAILSRQTYTHTHKYMDCLYHTQIYVYMYIDIFWYIKRLHLHPNKRTHRNEFFTNSYGQISLRKDTLQDKKLFSKTYHPKQEPLRNSLMSG
eukprot:TRINITY_DN3629_c2_g2_i2.p1 TRINITY_DN3629_c2_g2~~TRINITY_DN3629_c2_g2_i2.p1  ORF type:complete len:290 (+),score=-22.01 TRINITY_DN3629_c2_g2_i2:979-1848(+)